LPALPDILKRIQGTRVALFHDAIALKLTQYTPINTVARFPSYLHSLTQFDGIAAVSADSRDVLLAYWQWAGWKNTPPVVAIPLGVDTPPPQSIATSLQPLTAKPIILCVCTLEGRKNHLSLFKAAESLWAGGHNFELHVIGMLQRQTGRDAFVLLQSLQAKCRPLRYDGPVTDEALEAAYARCTFTVYPSLMEGFGLPVLESVHRGTPCICLNRGALAESAAGGGCLALDTVTPEALAAGLRDLLTHPTRLADLAREATARPVRTWADYTRDLLAFMGSVQRRSR
jgi:glycosyltransferase involved in cell wall biosynthesis